MPLFRYLHFNNGNLELLEQLTGLAETSEIRRNKTLQEMDRHRAAFAERARRLPSDFEDADFTDIRPAQKVNLPRVRTS
jgi:hypothetical protein